MNTEFLNKLHEKTVAFEHFNPRESDKTFDEAETEFFEWVEKAKNNGMNPIGNGGFRDVYTGGSITGNDTVIKISRGSGVQNDNAVRAWNELPDEAKQYVAPIHNWDSNRNWIVQAKATGRGNATEVGTALAEHGYSVSDLNGENVATYNGQSVLIDLGQLY